MAAIVRFEDCRSVASGSSRILRYGTGNGGNLVTKITILRIRSQLKLRIVRLSVVWRQ
jgi:hypothetical protein